MADYKKLTKAELVEKMENIEKLLDGSVEEALKKSEDEACLLKSAAVAGWLAGTIKCALEVIRE